MPNFRLCSLIALLLALTACAGGGEGTPSLLSSPDAINEPGADTELPAAFSCGGSVIEGNWQVQLTDGFWTPIVSVSVDSSCQLTIPQCNQVWEITGLQRDADATRQAVQLSLVSQTAASSAYCPREEVETFNCDLFYNSASGWFTMDNCSDGQHNLTFF